eukprot:g7872.t1
MSAVLPRAPVEDLGIWGQLPKAAQHVTLSFLLDWPTFNQLTATCSRLRTLCHEPPSWEGLQLKAQELDSHACGLLDDTGRQVLDREPHMNHWTVRFCRLGMALGHSERPILVCSGSAQFESLARHFSLDGVAWPMVFSQAQLSRFASTPGAQRTRKSMKFGDQPGPLNTSFAGNSTYLNLVIPKAALSVLSPFAGPFDAQQEFLVTVPEIAEALSERRGLFAEVALSPRSYPGLGGTWYEVTSVEVLWSFRPEALLQAELLSLCFFQNWPCSSASAIQDARKLFLLGHGSKPSPAASLEAAAALLRGPAPPNQDAELGPGVYLTAESEETGKVLGCCWCKGPPANRFSQTRGLGTRFYLEAASGSQLGFAAQKLSSGPCLEDDSAARAAAARRLAAAARAQVTKSSPKAPAPRYTAPRPIPVSTACYRSCFQPPVQQEADAYSEVEVPSWSRPLEERPGPGRSPRSPEAPATSGSAASPSMARQAQVQVAHQGVARAPTSPSLRLAARRPPAVASRPVEDDCAEYSDRFLPGYEKEHLLGRGACAVVWLATPTHDRRRPVAIKQVAKGTAGKKKSDTEAARKEILFGSYFFHTGGEPKVSPKKCPGIAHVAKLLDYVETKRDIWLVMDRGGLRCVASETTGSETWPGREEFGGTSLTKMAYEIKGEFHRGERLYRVLHLPLLEQMKRDVRALKAVLRQLLSALCLFADHRVVHSDIKPERTTTPGSCFDRSDVRLHAPQDNILVDQDETGGIRVRFIDLGSAFSFETPESLTVATPEYMPHEGLEVCAGRNGGGGATGNLSTWPTRGRSSLAARLTGTGPPSSTKTSSTPKADVDSLNQKSQPWSFDMWSLGSIVLEMSLGTPLWLSYKCRVASDQRTPAGFGLFAVPGRDPEKILLRQADAVCHKGLAQVLRNAAGGTKSGLDLLEQMMAWDPMARISPYDALAIDVASHLRGTELDATR